MSDLPDPAQDKRDLRDENERLKDTLRDIRRYLYGSRSAYETDEPERSLGHVLGCDPVKVIKSVDKVHPSSCTYRVEVIEAVAEIIENALNETTTDP